MYERLVKAMGEKMDADLAIAAWERTMRRIKKDLAKPENQPEYEYSFIGHTNGIVTSYSKQTNENYSNLQAQYNHAESRLKAWQNKQVSTKDYITSVENLAKQYGVDKELSALRRGEDIRGEGSTTSGKTIHTSSGKSGKSGKSTDDPNKEKIDQLDKERLALQLNAEIDYVQDKKTYREYQQALLAIDEDILTQKRDLYAVDSEEWNKYQKQLLDLAKERKEQEEQWNLELIQRNEHEEKMAAQQKFIDGEITEEQYNKRMNQIKLDYLDKYATHYKTINDPEKAAEYERQVEEESNRQKLELKREYLEQAKMMEQEYFAKSIDEREQMEIALLNELVEQGAIAADKKAEYEKKIREKYEKEREASNKKESPLGQATGVAGDFLDIFKRLEDLQKKIKDGKADWEDYAAVAVASLSFVSSTTAAVSQLFTAKQQEEENAINRRYDAEIKKAGENTTKGKKLEEKRQKELAKVKQKYNKKAMKMEIAQAVASTAMAAINAYASASKVSWLLGPIAAAMAVAAGGIQIAAIKKQHEAQAEGYYSGGFTGGSSYRREAGVVHEGEFVANHRAVNNPNILPVLRLIDHAQRNNTIASLTAADVSRSISAPQTAARAAASSAPALQLIDTTQGRTAAAIERLNTKLDEGIHASVSITGEDGIERQWTRYNNLKKNR